jgi:glutathione S-transferase
MSQPATAAVTLIALVIYFYTIIAVARARGQYGIKAPAVTGNEHFERAYRVQMNTLEQMALFLPALWLYAAYVSDRGAAVGGLIWVVGRVIYALAYVRDPASRGPGAMVTMFATVGLWLGSAYGVVRALI